MANEAAERPETETLCTRIEVETENGYRIVRLCQPADGASAEPGTYSFLVFDQHGRKREVVVAFEPTMVASLQQCRRPPLAPRSPFWSACAERTLATYLWEQDGWPPDGRLIIHAPCLDDVALALRWHD